MRKFIILFSLGFFSFCSCKNNGNYRINDELNKPIDDVELCKTLDSAYLKISPKKYKLGIVNKTRTPTLDIKYEIENVGKTPLIITKVDVSCNCLSVDYSQEPISVNNKSFLKVHIDLKNQRGTLDKVIYINSNAENNLVLARVIGEISE